MDSTEKTIEKLTRKEIEALDLVAQHLSTKEIAIELGVSPSAINQRIDSARTKLGGIRRTEAARILRRLQSSSACDQNTGYPFTVSEFDELPQSCVDKASDPIFRLNDASNFAPQAPWEGGFVPELKPERLGLRARLLYIVWGAVAIAMLLAILAGLITVMNSLF